MLRTVKDKDTRQTIADGQVKKSRPLIDAIRRLLSLWELQTHSWGIVKGTEWGLRLFADA